MSRRSGSRLAPRCVSRPRRSKRSEVPRPSAVTLTGTSGGLHAPCCQLTRQYKRRAALPRKQHACHHALHLERVHRLARQALCLGHRVDVQPIPCELAGHFSPLQPLTSPDCNLLLCALPLSHALHRLLTLPHLPLLRILSGHHQQRVTIALVQGQAYNVCRHTPTHATHMMTIE